MDGGPYDPRWREGLDELERDFQGRARGFEVMGAYGQAGPSPLQSWLDQSGFKEEGL
jgi:hypothetical protein